MQKQYTIRELELKANEIRIDIIKSLEKAKSGHSGGPLGMADVFCALYFSVLNHDPKNTDWEERDRLILSNGHITPVRYVTMAHAGYFPIKELDTLRKFGSRLQGHPERLKLPGVETTSGPLGSGLSQGSGMAYVGKHIDKKDWTVYVLTSDGEHDEGNTWEAVLFAAKYKLDNLVQIIDRNNIQIDGNTKDIMPLEPFREKYEAFNWNVIEIDGHDMQQIIDACTKAKSLKGKPTIIIANTIPGKGVSFMENRYEWHGAPPGKGIEDKVPKDKQAEVALKELEAIGAKLQ